MYEKLNNEIPLSKIILHLLNNYLNGFEYEYEFWIQ